MYGLTSWRWWWTASRIELSLQMFMKEIGDLKISFRSTKRTCYWYFRLERYLVSCHCFYRVLRSAIVICFVLNNIILSLAFSGKECLRIQRIWVVKSLWNCSGGQRWKKSTHRPCTWNIQKDFSSLEMGFVEWYWLGQGNAYDLLIQELISK